MAKSKTEIVAGIAESAEITRKQAEAALESLVRMAYEEARNGFMIPGLGKLIVVDRPARKGRNPATGQEMDIPARKAVKFRVAKAAKDAILS